MAFLFFDHDRCSCMKNNVINFKMADSIVYNVKSFDMTDYLVSRGPDSHTQKRESGQTPIPTLF